MDSDSQLDEPPLLEAFRMHYVRYENVVHEVLLSPTDVTVVARLGDDLDAFSALAMEVC